MKTHEVKLFGLVAVGLGIVVAFSSLLVTESRAESVRIFWPVDALGRNVTLLLPHQWTNRKNSVSQDNTPGHIPSTMLLQALLPRIEPMTRENSEAFDVPDGGELTTLLLHSLSVADYKGAHFDQLKNRVDYESKGLMHVCVRDYTKPVDQADATKCTVFVAPFEKGQAFGLRRYGVDFTAVPMPADQMMLYDDMLLETNDAGVVTTMIRCTAAELENVRSPWTGNSFGGNCEEFFTIESLNAFAQVNFNEKYLENWRDIRSRWRSTLESFATAGRRK